MVSQKGFLKYSRRDRALRAPEERIKDFEELEVAGEEESTISQAKRCMDCGVPFCTWGCPLGNPVPGFNQLSQEENWHEALKLLHATNNFPEFTGKVCPAPCESSCVLGLIRPPVAIKQLEEKIAMKGLEQGWIRPEKPAFRTGKRVTVVGSGPAGLACAQQLNRMGHWVTVLDKSPVAGGLLSQGIPAYKLPRELVLNRVRQMEAEDVRFQLNCSLGADISLDQLQAENDAVVLCLGAEIPRDLPVPGRELKGIHFAMDFLRQQSLDCHTGHKTDVRGKRVMVIGGGDTGADCIGTSLRLGAASVTNLELKPRLPEERGENNPWPEFALVFKSSSSAEENAAAGGSASFSMMTTRFTKDGKGNLAGVETCELEWSKAAPGEFLRKPGSEKVWACDVVFLAMGYLGPDTASAGLSPDSGLRLNRAGNIETCDTNRMSSRNGVFAAGDCRTGQSLVVRAIAEGRQTARQVDIWLSKRKPLHPELSVPGEAPVAQAIHP